MDSESFGLRRRSRETFRRFTQSPNVVALPQGRDAVMERRIDSDSAAAPVDGRAYRARSPITAVPPSRSATTPSVSSLRPTAARHGTAWRPGPAGRRQTGRIPPFPGDSTLAVTGDQNLIDIAQEIEPVEGNGLIQGAGGLRFRLRREVWATEETARSCTRTPSTTLVSGGNRSVSESAGAGRVQTKSMNGRRK